MVSVALRVVVLYVLVELTAVVALTWALGFGWMVLVVVGLFAAGVMLALGQLKRNIRRLGRPAASVLADSGLVALGTGLVLVPGPVTTLAGLLLLAPPTRSAARPLLSAAAVAAMGRRTPLVAAAAAGRHWYTSRRSPAAPSSYIDAEFVDLTGFGDFADRQDLSGRIGQPQRALTAG